MTLNQIKYFVEVSKCLNFTGAASRLYITQPTLSRQITAIEAELNMQLLIRSSKSLRLTPAGALLSKEFSKLLDTYDTIISSAREASAGMTGSLRLGIIDGYNVHKLLPCFIEYLEGAYPNIKIHLERFSFGQLIEDIYNLRLDAIITYGFDVIERPGLECIQIAKEMPMLSVPKRNALAQKQAITLKDMANEQLVIVKTDECASGVRLVAKTFRQFGGFYPNFYFVDKMEDAILWVESGVKCALFNTGMSIVNSESVRNIVLNELPPMEIMLCYHPQNTNFALPILLQYFENMLYKP